MNENETRNPQEPNQPAPETPQAPETPAQGQQPDFQAPDYFAAYGNAVGQGAQPPQPPQVPPGYAAPQYVRQRYEQQYHTPYTGAQPMPQPPQAQQAQQQPPQQPYPPYGQPVQPQQPGYTGQVTYDVPPAGYVQKSRLAAAVLALLLGVFGVHNFYLGFNTRGVIQLVVALAGGLVTCGLASVAIEVWALIEAMQLFTGIPSRLYDGHGVITRE